MRTWRLEPSNLKGFVLIIENETQKLIAQVSGATDQELELMRKAPEFAYGCRAALEELVLHEKMAKQTGDTDLLDTLTLLRKMLAPQQNGAVQVLMELWTNWPQYDDEDGSDPRLTLIEEFLKEEGLIDE